MSRSRQRRHLWRWRRRVGDRRDDRLQRAKRTVPPAGRRRRRGSSDEGAEPGLGALLAELPARRPAVPVHRKVVDPYRGSQRTRHLPRVVGQPDRAATPPDLSSAVYAAPGYLVFVREGTLTAAPFELTAGQVTGPPVAIGEAVATEPQFYFAAISASADGTLAVRPPPAAVPINADMNASNAELRLVDRSGTGNRVGAARLFSSLMALNPIDSRILAASILDPRAGTQDLGLMDLTKDSMAPLTATRGFAGYPCGRPMAGACLRIPASRRVGRRIHQGHRHRVDSAGDRVARHYRASARLVPRREVPAHLRLR